MAEGWTSKDPLRKERKCERDIGQFQIVHWNESHREKKNLVGKKKKGSGTRKKQPAPRTQGCKSKWTAVGHGGHNSELKSRPRCRKESKRSQTVE